MVVGFPIMHEQDCLPATLASVTIPLAKLHYKNSKNNSCFRNLLYSLKNCEIALNCHFDYASKEDE